LRCSLRRPAAGIRVEAAAAGMPEPRELSLQLGSTPPSTHAPEPPLPGRRSRANSLQRSTIAWDLTGGRGRLDGEE